VAHLGYFRRELVERRGWCSEQELGELIALAQSLPGPASSQVGFALGILRAGWLGGLAAWVGFTLPSALLMLGFAMMHGRLAGAMGVALLHGLQIVAVAVVAQAVVAMQRSLAPDRVRVGMAVLAASVVLLVPGQFVTLAVIGGGALAGLGIWRRVELADGVGVSLPLLKGAGVGLAGAFLGLLVLLPVVAGRAGWLTVFAAFYRSGALVFGGGHVVLPLLEGTVVVPGWVSQESFLAGYGAAQALPGPLFSFAAYLGAVIRLPLGVEVSPYVSGLVALLGVSAPGLLLMAAVMPFWGALRRNGLVQAALRGVNAVVVGILIAALYSPLWTSTIVKTRDFWLALAGFAMLTVGRLPPWVVVAGVAGATVLMAVFGL